MPLPSPAPRSNTAVWLVTAVLLVGLVLVGTLNQGAKNSTGSSKTSYQDPLASNGDLSTAVVQKPTSVADQSQSPEVPNLDNVIKFSAPSDCSMTPATQKLFDGLINFDPETYVGSRGGDVNIPGFPISLTPTFSRKVGQGDNPNVRDNEATLPIAGTWHGLKVSKIRVRLMEESSFWEHQIRFLEPASRVRTTLNNLGFNLPSVGDFRKFTGPDAVSAGIGVEEIAGGSALYCGSSIYY